MPTLAKMPLRDQFEILRRMTPNGENPFRPYPSTIVIVQMPVPAPAAMQPAAAYPVPVKNISIDLRHDPRVRFTKPDDKAKTEPREIRPWLQAHPVGHASAVVRLTSEGTRRLAALADIMETQGVLPPRW